MARGCNRSPGSRRVLPYPSNSARWAIAVPSCTGDVGATPIPREFSEETACQIDAQIQQLLTQAEARVRETIMAYRAALNELAQLLLTQETVERQSLTKILRDSKRSRTVPSTTDAVATA